MTQAETVFRLQGNYSSDELAKHTKAMFEAKGIKSPDVTQMFSIKRGKSMYYYNTEEKYQRALAKFEEEDNQNRRQIAKNSENEKTSDPINRCGNCQLRAMYKGKWICTNGHRANKRVYMKTKACQFIIPIKTE